MSLPPLFDAWARDLFGGPLPDETVATCHDCVMCGPTLREPDRFLPDVKCCTFYPELPNFLIGAILSDPDPALDHGRAVLRARIEKGMAVVPMGIARTPVFGVLYQQGAGAFGKTRALRCPYFVEDSGGCGIWRYREATCATWFCRYTRGQVGREFWQLTFLPLLKGVEGALSRWCLLQLNIGDTALAAMNLPDPATQSPPILGARELDGTMDPGFYAVRWGAWAGREEAFYLACFEAVRGLTWAEVLQIGGIELQIQARQAWLSFQRLIQPQVPEIVKIAPFQAVELLPEFARLITYSAYDPVDVPRALFDLLPYLPGRPLAESLTAISQETGVQIPDVAIQRLFDFGVLQPGS